MLIRIKYGKTLEGKYLSHLDLMRAWERTIRRAKAPLAFSQGFNPHPKISFASALAVGTTSDGEYMDMELTEERNVDLLREQLEHAMPPAIKLYEMVKIPDKSPALMSVVNRARYQLGVSLVEAVSQEQADQVTEQFLNNDLVNVLRFKKNSKEKREVNIRPGVIELNVEATQDQLKIQMLVQTGSEGNVRPEEVVYGLMANGLPIVKKIDYIHREGLYIMSDDGLKMPME